MFSPDRSVLLDVTRLVARSWSARQPTGIDRVCYAYLKQFASRALAVIQHRGVVRVLDARRTDRLFELLQGPDRNFRVNFTNFAARALVKGSANQVDGRGMVYLNVSHTDFDLLPHHLWIKRCGLKAVYFLHDLIPVTHPDFCRPRAVRRHLGRVVGALRNADGIIVGSRSVADELRRFAEVRGLPVPQLLISSLAPADLVDRVRTSRHGAAEESTDGRCCDGDPYFVCVGTIEPRKNHALLIDVWQSLLLRLGERAPRLIIVGQSVRAHQHLLAQMYGNPALARHVSLMDKCSDEELASLLKGARALLLPSRAEGFGLPMVEAFQLGVPVLASDIDIFREIGGGVPRLIAPGDRAQWESAILEYAQQSPDRSRQIEQLLHYSPQTWHGHFFEVENWLQPEELAANHAIGDKAGRWLSA